MTFGTIIGIIAILCAVWVIYDVFVNNKRLSDGMKVLWVVLAIFFNIITAIIYYLVGRDSKIDLFKNRRSR
jgi:multisubunit Na+/H+ antiporter MnhG subunit